MKAGAEYLIGEHDFSAFRSVECGAENPVRTVLLLNIEKSDDVIIFDIEANAFLHSMVRTIVGTLLDLGRGRFEVEDVRRILESKDRNNAGPTAPPQGLILMQVTY